MLKGFFFLRPTCHFDEHERGKCSGAKEKSCTCDMPVCQIITSKIARTKFLPLVEMTWWSFPCGETGKGLLLRQRLSHLPAILHSLTIIRINNARGHA